MTELLAIVAAAIALYAAWPRLRRVRGFLRTRVRPYLGGDRRIARLAYIDSYRFPDAVLAKFAAEHPSLGEHAHAQVFAALKDYFAICAADPGTPAAMPSRIVDEAWHCFLLFTRAYHDFCTRAFGRYLHHAPADARRGMDAADAELRHTWQLACAREGVEPLRPTRLPPLFALDRRLKIEGGTYYAHNAGDAAAAQRMLGTAAMVHLVGVMAGAPWADAALFQAAAPADRPMGGYGGDAAGGEFAGNDIAFGGDAGGMEGGGCSGGGT